MLQFLLDNPWVFPMAGGLAFVLWLDHWFKEKRRGQIGRDLVRYKKEEHRQARPVIYPPSLKGKKGRVRAGAQDSATDSFAQWRTWPLWLTLTLITLAGIAIAVLLWMNGYI